MFQLVLGSQSPRRKEILSFFDIPFKIATPTFDEDSVRFTGNPEHHACLLSKGKADSLSTVYPQAMILTADTIVYQNGIIYGKPQGIDEARKTLSALSGQWHSVFTAITLQKDKKQFHKVEESRVLFNTLSEEHMKTYLDRCHWSDKAGGYGIQMGSSLLIKKIDGCYYNVMGLPVNTLRELFLNFNIDLWKHIKS